MRGYRGQGILFSDSDLLTMVCGGGGGGLASCLARFLKEDHCCWQTGKQLETETSILRAYPTNMPRTLNILVCPRRCKKKKKWYHIQDTPSLKWRRYDRSLALLVRRITTLVIYNTFYQHEVRPYCPIRPFVIISFTTPPPPYTPPRSSLASSLDVRIFRELYTAG